FRAIFFHFSVPCILVLAPFFVRRYVPGFTENCFPETAGACPFSLLIALMEKSAPRSGSDTVMGHSFHWITARVLSRLFLPNRLSTHIASGSTSSRHTPFSTLSRKYAPRPSY